MKIARVFVKTGKELSKRTFAQSGHIGAAIQKFIEEGNDLYSYEHIYGFKNEKMLFYGIQTSKVSTGLYKVTFDSGYSRYYRLYE